VTDKTQHSELPTNPNQSNFLSERHS